MAPASRISRSGSSPGRSPVSVRIRVAIARAASAQARSATAACSTPRSASSAVFGLPSSSALSTAFQAAARGSAGASSAWASGMVMGWTPSKSAARASKIGTVQSMSITIRMRRTPTMRMARSSGTEQRTKQRNETVHHERSLRVRAGFVTVRLVRYGLGPQAVPCWRCGLGGRECSHASPTRQQGNPRPDTMQRPWTPSLFSLLDKK